MNFWNMELGTVLNVGVARELILAKGVFRLFGGTGPHFGYLSRLDSGHIVHFHFCATPRNYIFFCL